MSPPIRFHHRDDPKARLDEPRDGLGGAGEDEGAPASALKLSRQVVGVNAVGPDGERAAQVTVTWGRLMRRDHHPRRRHHAGRPLLGEEGRVEDGGDAEDDGDEGQWGLFAADRVTEVRPGAR